MLTMIERVVESMNAELLSSGGIWLPEKMAEAAIRGMRQPTEAMVSPEVSAAHGVYGDVEATAVWKRLIDRALDRK